MMKYEFDTPDESLIKKVREAVEFDRNGDPVKDAIDEDEMIQAMYLLLEIIDAEAK